MFFQYKTLSASGWDKDSLLLFDVTIDDTLSTYNLYVNIRNSSIYSYQNFWFFTDCISPKNVKLSDTTECYLADERGKWLGSGVGSLFEMPVLMDKNVKFDTTGVYRYEIRHGMREDVLEGINDIGLRVEKVTAP